jgi:hypothetical protein
MLIVLAHDQKRYSSAQLKDAFYKINSYCTDKDDGYEYCLKGITKKTVVPPAIPVQFMLNENAKNMAKQNCSHLSFYDGTSRLSMTVEELRRML